MADNPMELTYASKRRHAARLHRSAAAFSANRRRREASVSVGSMAPEAARPRARRMACKSTGVSPAKPEQQGGNLRKLLNSSKALISTV